MKCAKRCIAIKEGTDRNCGKQCIIDHSIGKPRSHECPDGHIWDTRKRFGVF